MLDMHSHCIKMENHLHFFSSSSSSSSHIVAEGGGNLSSKKGKKFGGEDKLHKKYIVSNLSHSACLSRSVTARVDNA
jgi:hypothetical protein